MKFILGKKIEMSQVFAEDGAVIPVTKVEAGPCQVTQIRTQEKDGCNAVQVGFGSKKLNKPLGGHLKGLANYRHLVEFKAGDSNDSNTSNDSNKLKRGDLITVASFEVGDKVKVTGVSKGKGFQGVVKRHGFHGQSATHGTKDQERAPGSIGATEPARVFPGTRMPGRMGGEQVSVANLEIVKVDEDKGLLYIKGAVPGARNGLVGIYGEGNMVLENSENKKAKKQENKEEIKKQEIEKQRDDESNGDEKKLEDGKEK